MKKRIFSMIICAVLIVGMCFHPDIIAAIYANENISFTIVADKHEAAIGEVVTYTVNIGPIDKLSAMNFTLSVPNGLEYISGEVCSGLKERLKAEKAEYTDETKTFVMYGGNYSNDTACSLITFTCKVSNEASEGDILKLSFVNDYDVSDLSFASYDTVINTDSSAIKVIKSISTPELTSTPESTATPEPVATPTINTTPSEGLIPTETAAVTESPVKIMSGDVNQDGFVDASDALLVLKHAAKLSMLESEVLPAADINADNIIDASDALMILKVAARLLMLNENEAEEIQTLSMDGDLINGYKASEVYTSASYEEELEIILDYFDSKKYNADKVVEGDISYYGRYALSQLSNAKALLYAYDKIVEGVENSEERIYVYDSTPISIDEIFVVMDAYYRDHTEQFWMGNSYSISYNSKTVISISPQYIMSGDKLDKARNEFKCVVDDMLSDITAEMSEYEVEKLLHDKLAARVSYVFTDNAYNSYGALVEGKAVCEGYAEAYQYLLQMAGIQSFIATGYSNNPSTSVSVAHAWNIVRIDGKYYHVDVTWDDQGEYLFYAYFNKTDAAFSEDHVLNTASYALPVCDSKNADYAVVSGGEMESFDAKTVGNYLKKQSLKVHIYVTGDKDKFISNFTKEIKDVAKYAGLSGGISYRYVNLGREYIISIGNQAYTYSISGNVNSFNSNTGEILIQLISKSDNKMLCETKVKGNSAYYYLTDIPNGHYTLKVSKNNHATREYEINVSNKNLVQDLEINLIGDIDGDGNVNSKDLNMIYEYLKNSISLDEYALDCADVAEKKSVVNSEDLYNIYKHVNKTKALW